MLTSRLVAMLWRLEALGLEVVATMVAGLVAWSIGGERLEARAALGRREGARPHLAASSKD